jgi:hypothetical protein
MKGQAGFAGHLAPGSDLTGASFVPFMPSWLAERSQWPQEIFDPQPVPRFGAEKDKVS